jgi:LEA14-like dessication related protein
MAKNSLNLIKTSVLLSALFILTGCGKPQDLKYGTITNVTLKNLSFTGVNVEATVPVENPNGYSMRIKDAELDLIADDKVIAHITQSYPITIAGNSKADYRVGAFIKLTNLSEISGLYKLMRGNSNLNLDGTVKVKVFLFQRKVEVHEKAIQAYLKPVWDQMKLF